MDCLQLRHQPAGPFHYLISEQAKSLVALQELQHEVGALLQFRDLVMETFPNLRTKLGASAAMTSPHHLGHPSAMTSPHHLGHPSAMTSPHHLGHPSAMTSPHHLGDPSTMTSPHHLGDPSARTSPHHLGDPSAMTSPHHLGDPSAMTSPHHHHSNIPVSVRPGEWAPGVRVRKKIGSKEEGGGRKVGDVAVQDSGFSTETSSKETHSASSSSAPLASSSAPSGAPENDEVEDELWNLLDIIHRKGTRLKDEAEALQGTIRQQDDLRKESDRSFHRALFHSTSNGDFRQLRQERDLLLDRLAEMEAEVLAGRVHTSRLQEDLENLLSTKQDLEEQLKAVVTQRGEVNSRIHDLHRQFVKSGSSSTECDKNNRPSSTACSSSQRTNRKSAFSEIDGALSEEIPKVANPDSKKISAILKEHDPLVLQKHLLTTTVRNQVLREQLDSAAGLEIGLRDKLDKVREENEDLRFQLQDRNIELEGTRARVRMLESLQPRPATGKTSSPDIIPALESPAVGRPEISTPSMRAMMPLDFDSLKAGALDHSSSTESAHNESAERERRATRRPSKIPLKSYTAPKPPAGTRSRSGDSPHRSHSAQSWRNNKSEGNSLNGPPKLAASLPKSRNSSLVTAKDSLSSKLRNSESPLKLSDSPKQARNSLKAAATVNASKKAAGLPVKKEPSAVGDKIINSNSSKEKSQSPWNLCSYNSEPEDLAYPDSLDKSIESIHQSNSETMSSRCFQTANTFLWTVGNQRAANIEYYDSIDTNLASSLFHHGEELAECDSLERQLSGFSDRK